tara:strand:+ start:4428 stop:4619 length:192 start_codon:yes stop_codon:yes gene_type:complete
MDDEKNYMDDMIASIFDGDREEFSSAFQAEIGERIGQKMANKESEISSNLINSSEEDDLEEES